jgi:hypothetical protein
MADNSDYDEGRGKLEEPEEWVYYTPEDHCDFCVVLPSVMGFEMSVFFYMKKISCEPKLVDLREAVKKYSMKLRPCSGSKHKGKNRTFIHKITNPPLACDLSQKICRNFVISNVLVFVSV